MKILGIDTSSSACSIGLLLDEKVISHHEIAPMRQAKIILPVIEKILSDNKIALAELDAIAFGCGPGSFTGVRISISVAQGLGFAANLPMISVSSLAALAQSTWQDLGWKKILAVIDARINEVYFGKYQVNDKSIVELSDHEVVSAPENLLFPDECDWCGAGNGWSVYRDKLSYQPVQVDAKREANVAGLLTLAKEKFQAGEYIKAGDAVPVYLRDDVAVKGK